MVWINASLLGLEKDPLLYFFSYARADETRFLRKFYKDLREAVRSKAGFPDAESIAFQDAQTIEPGKPWTVEIEKALQNCKVFVYLHTPTYFGRHGCGKEFQVIKHRLQLDHCEWRVRACFMHTAHLLGRLQNSQKCAV